MSGDVHVRFCESLGGKFPRATYPVRLFAELPAHLERMALFDVNTGLRASELCGLRWSWEIQVPELNTSVFMLPEEMTKNGEERIVVLNRIARSVIESERGKNCEYVFTYNGDGITRINNHAWRKARGRASLPQVRVHDLRHYSEFRIIPSTSIKANGRLGARRMRLGIIKAC